MNSTSLLLFSCRAFHESSPLVPGMRRQELLDRLAPNIDPRLFQWVLDRLAESGAMRVQQEFLSLPSHRPALQQGQQKLKDTVIGLYTGGGLMPPTRREVVENSGVREKELAEILQLLVREGALVRLNDDLYYTAESMRDLSEQAVLFMQQHGELTIQGFKEQTGLTRKFLIPIFSTLTAPALRSGWGISVYPVKPRISRLPQKPRLSRYSGIALIIRLCGAR